MLAAKPSNINLYGRGVFTTIAVRGGDCVFWEKHWRRLSEHASRLNVDLSEFADGSVYAAVVETLLGDRVTNGRARVSFLDESTSPLWSARPEKGTTLSIITGPIRPIPQNFRLTVSPYKVNSTSPLVGMKSCNYLDPLLSIEEAKGRGFDEAVRLNERGEVAGACLANVFWIKGGRCFTPSLRTGCLAGTTREYILENLECSEVEAPIEELKSAEAMFITSAGVGVAAVAEFEGKKLQMEGFPITKLLPF